MHELIPFVKDLAIMLGIASVVTILFQKIRQPVILGYIIAGIIIGPYTPPYSLVTDFTQIHTISELGVIFLMFSLGLDFSFHKLKRLGFSTIITGLFKVLALFVLGFGIGRVMQWSFYDCVFFGAAIAISSTTIIIKAIEELKLTGKKFTDVVFGILIVEDLLAVLMLTTLSTVVITSRFFSFDTIEAAIKLVLVIGSWFLVGYFVVPILFRRIVKYINQETLTIVSTALCLFMAVTAAYFHYSTALGAFIMGSILAETSLAPRIKQLVSPLRDVFAAVFFISIGMLINIKILIDHWAIILIFSLIAITGKTIITSVGAFLTGQSVGTSIRTGFSMTPVGEFSFIIMSLGLSLGVISNKLYQMIIGMAAITTLVTPYFMILSGIITEKLNVTFSDRSKYFLASYSAWIYRTLASYNKKKEYRKLIMRLIINGIIVAIIFTLTSNLASPQIINLIHSPNIAKIICWMIALLVSSPFIWGILSGFRLVDKNRLIPTLFLSIIVTILEIIILSVTYFNTWYIPLIISIVMITLFCLFYRHLGNFYHWFEVYLVRMLKRKSQQQNKYEELAPWDTYLVEIKVTNDSSESVAGKTMSENKLRQKFGINIVAIRRGSKVILIPRSEEKILLQDELVVLGNDEQIEAFRKKAEDILFEEKPENILKSFSLTAIVLDSDNTCIGKSIRDSQIREKINGMVVGLERNGFRSLNPDPATILKVNDLLLIVGQGAANN
jgi:CPA2 family monovalent cation:H+ antiporter-2